MICFLMVATTNILSYLLKSINEFALQSDVSLDFPQKKTFILLTDLKYIPYTDCCRKYYRIVRKVITLFGIYKYN